MQVRDGACLASASCVLAYPEACRPQLAVLFPLWVQQLDDNVWSVRAHAAMALADVVRAYHQPALDVVLPCLRCAVLVSTVTPKTSIVRLNCLGCVYWLCLLVVFIGCVNCHPRNQHYCLGCVYCDPRNQHCHATAAGS